jgi:hypothetical protein
MADSKISALPASTTPLAGTEVLPIVQSSATKQVSVANLTAGRAISATQLTLTTGNLIVASGQGIDFSATPGTGTSELLDDYEKGTWTPAIGVGITSPTYATQTGTYTKIGDTVFFQCYLSVNGGTRNSGGLTISGLPFVASGVGGSASFAYVGGGAQTALATIALPILNVSYSGSATTVYFYRTTGAEFVGTDLSSSTARFDFSGQYTV